MRDEVRVLNRRSDATIVDLLRALRAYRSPKRAYRLCVCGVNRPKGGLSQRPVTGYKSLLMRDVCIYGDDSSLNDLSPLMPSYVFEACYK